ncbi:MAG: hypothetical protein U1E33_00425 [Rhodospirillales bacterium]
MTVTLTGVNDASSRLPTTRLLPKMAQPSQSMCWPTTTTSIPTTIAPACA